VGGEPVGQLLGREGLGVREVGCTQDRHEELGRGDLARERVGDRDGLPGEVDEAVLAGAMVTPEDEVEPPGEGVDAGF
jgi:hypothetical protein